MHFDQFGGLIRSASEAEITSSSGFAVQYPDNLSTSAESLPRSTTGGASSSREYACSQARTILICSGFISNNFWQVSAARSSLLSCANDAPAPAVSGAT